MDIRHGTLLNVFGAKASHGGFTFVPAYVQLAGQSFRSGFPLGEQPRERIPAGLYPAIEEGVDAAWVRARLPRVFHFTPTTAEVEKSLLDVGFVAVAEQQGIAYPFICTDHYGRTALSFSEEGPDESTKQAIADAFWGLLCLHPDDLSDFEAPVYHSGAGVWLTFGCQAGQLSCDEADDIVTPTLRLSGLDDGTRGMLRNLQPARCATL